MIVIVKVIDPVAMLVLKSKVVVLLHIDPNYFDLHLPIKVTGMKYQVAIVSLMTVTVKCNCICLHFVCQ